MNNEDTHITRTLNKIRQPPPASSVPPKDRAQLWKETLMGFALAIFGGVLIWQYTMHSEHGHVVDKSVLWVGVGCLVGGLWMTNRKLMMDLAAQIRKFIPFVKNGGGK